MNSGKSRFNETEGMNRRNDIEPQWQDEDDWLCTVEFVPRDDPEGRLFAANIVGHLFGYAQLTNTRALALSAILMPAHTSFFFPFRRLGTKISSWIWFARMRNGERLHRERFLVAYEGRD